MITSPILTGPMTFLVRILPLSRPSITLHFTLVTPFVPARPKTVIISAGVASSGIFNQPKIRLLCMFFEIFFQLAPHSSGEERARILPLLCSIQDSPCEKPLRLSFLAYQDHC